MTTSSERVHQVRVAPAPVQVRVLARTFLERFFDNEITSGTGDMRASFFHLVAFLATPGFFYAGMMSMNWTFIGRLRGPSVLRWVSINDKALYLGLSMVAAGIVAAVVWSSLLVDRRDGLVLGTLPVRSRSIVQAKLLAVTGYVALIAASMHALGAPLWGFFLGSYDSFGFVARGTVVHLVAGFAACLFVFATILAAQGVSLFVLGPRRFGRVTSGLQLLLVGVVLLGLLSLPGMSQNVRPLVSGAASAQWLMWMPPIWFLGLYESLLGTSSGTLQTLGWTACAALALSVAVAAITYPVAYHRVMRDAVERPEGLGRVGVWTAPARWLTAILTRRAKQRAVMQFALASLGRGDRHRFVLALAAGAVLAWALPTIVDWHELAGSPPAPSRALLAAPLAAMLFLLVGLRVALGIPSDVRAWWIFDSVDLSRTDIQSALRRLMMALVVLPIAAVAVFACGEVGGMRFGLAHGLVCLAAGWMVVELLLRRWDEVPCAAPWRPERANLKVWWPAYLVGFVLFATTSRHALAAYTLKSYSADGRFLTLVGLLVVAAMALRWYAPRPQPPDPPTLDGLNVREVLDLN